MGVFENFISRNMQVLKTLEPQTLFLNKQGAKEDIQML